MAIRLPTFPAGAQCAPCDGACCKVCPGSTSPDDWGAPDLAVMEVRLRDAPASGRWAVDQWDGDDHHADPVLRDDVLYVRPAAQGRERLDDPFDRLVEEDRDDDDLIARAARRMIPPRFPCTFLGSAGCALAFEARPIECRALKPRPGPVGDCLPHAGGQEERAVEWAPYQALLHTLLGR